MNKLLNRIEFRRCPLCASAEVRRAPRKNTFESVVLRILLLRPFHCEGCDHRFYGLAGRKRAPVLEERNPRPDFPMSVQVIVYGYNKDKEPFQEETAMHLMGVSSAMLSLATFVEPGQELMLLSPETEEDQRCRVAFITEQHAGRSILGVRFDRPAWEFRSIAVPPNEV